MPKTTTPPATQTTEQTVDAWREHELTAAGYPETLALLIGADHDIDLHQACDLLHKGCPTDIAARILL